MDRLTRIALAVIALTTFVVIASSAPAPVSVGRVIPAPNMLSARASHSSTLLRDGRVLIAGGMVKNGVFLNSAETYDPAKNTFALVGSMQSPRTSHTATLLPDGKVLITGGWAGRRSEGGPGIVASTEIYDPATGRFAPGPSMKAARAGHAAIALSDGKVLIVGGSDNDEHPLSTAELYDPGTASFASAASMHAARAAFSASLLNDGRVLVAGGTADERHALASAEVYDSRTQAWQAVGDMTAAREKHAATVLPDGRVLITGGSPDWQWHALPNAEVFDPATGRFTAISQMEAARFKIPHATVTLKNGNALVAGGAADVEVYDVGRGKFSRAGSVDGPHYFSSATLLRDGRVLITGGYGTGSGRANGPLSTDRVWIYQP